MNNRGPRTARTGNRLMDRLEHAAKGVNAVLMVFAIGLALLDLTCLFAFEARSALPSPARVSAGPPRVSHFAKPQKPSEAAARQVSPTHAGVLASSW